MITANLMVSDMPRAVAFWRDALGFTVTFAVDAQKETRFGPDASPEGAIFAVLAWNGHELMLQTGASLAADLPETFDPPDHDAAPKTAIYLRGYKPEEGLARVPPACVLKGPALAWYGMNELYLRDPDGHVVCLAAPEGEGPA